MVPGERVEIKSQKSDIKGRTRTEIMSGIISEMHRDYGCDDIQYRPMESRVSLGNYAGPTEMTVVLDGKSLGEFEKLPEVPTKREEVKMKYKATLIRDKSRKRTSIRLELVDKPEVYLTADGDEIERKMGEEMPEYGNFPDEILGPILAAAYNDPEFRDMPRDCIAIGGQR